MYHALWRDAIELERIDAADRPYALEQARFASQIDTLREHRLEVLDAAALARPDRPLDGVVLSFDDGHASSALLALPVLRERGMRAVFFVTTGFVGNRPGYCSVAQLREMAAQGMEIGGHGHTHRFLSDLSDPDLGDEMQRSHGLLSDWLGAAPRQMSFPGGRYDQRALDAAARHGFEILHGSVPGKIAPGPLPRVLPRIAVRAGMPEAAWLAHAEGRASALLRTQAAHATKALLRRLLGNAGYHRLYRRIRG
jgi:peptidoglycan/xylan/chitin deacetylase (PgdA/CDA1 family)